MRARDDRDIGGAEGFGEQDEVSGGGALLNRAGELPAVVDQSAEDAEDVADAAGHARIGPMRIGPTLQGTLKAPLQHKEAPEPARRKGEKASASRASSASAGTALR